jgi:hypothetical protein
MSEPLNLPALDGANPLGFLATLGTLAALSKEDSQIKLGWRDGAKWTPYLISSQPLEETNILRQLAVCLRGTEIDPTAERKRKASQVRFEAAKKRLKDVREELKTLKLRGNHLKSERERIVIPVEQKLKRRHRIFLARLQKSVPSPELALGQRPDCLIDEFRRHARTMRGTASMTNRTSIDLLASFGAELSGESEKQIVPTPFCFITGSGHQWFLDTARDLMKLVTEVRLRDALFEPWEYVDEKLTMRWDPLDDRRYALMDRDPTASDNKSTTVWMANLLAYIGLSLFPCAPVRRGFGTVGWFQGKDSIAFRWPIWKPPLGADSIRSLIVHPAFAASDYEGERRSLRTELLARGVEAIFSARRIQVGNPQN